MIRHAFSAVILAVALVVGTVVGVTPAHAHSFGPQGPPHTHFTPCPAGDCNRFILANGAIWQANGAKLVQSYGYVLVLCSTRFANGTWHMVTYPYGPWGNVGSQHGFCLNPTYAGQPWPIRP